MPLSRRRPRFLKAVIYRETTGEDRLALIVNVADQHAGLCDLAVLRMLGQGPKMDITREDGKAYGLANDEWRFIGDS